MNDAASLIVHSVFDVAAWASAALAGLWLIRGRQVDFPVAPDQRLSYYAALVTGAASGAYLFGTLNLLLSGLPGIARSIEGAVAGAILSTEMFKGAAGIATRTGARFALPLAVGIAVGRIGCFFAGLPDFTYGTTTGLPWGVDFGDGVRRHPVQLYESAAMAAFAALYLLAIKRNARALLAKGFYLCVGFYGAQRFAWEFLKPYGTIVGPFTTFHVLSAGLVVYALYMLASHPEDLRERAAFDPLRS